MRVYSIRNVVFSNAIDSTPKDLIGVRAFGFAAQKWHKLFVIVPWTNMLSLYQRFITKSKDFDLMNVSEFSDRSCELFI